MEEYQKSPKKQSVCLYPLPAMGHIVSMFELGKLLAKHNFSVTMIIVEPTRQEFKCLTDSALNFISRVSSTNPSISFHKLPSTFTSSSPYQDPEAYIFDLLHHSNPNLLQYLNSLPSPPSALVLDLFCLDALDICNQLNIPSYIFWVSCGYSLSSAVLFPKIHDSLSVSLRELGSKRIEIDPRVPSLPADHFPAPLQNRNGDAYKCFLKACTRIVEVKGVIMNTVEAIEKNTVDAIKEYKRPVYCIGPLVNSESRDQNNAKDCLAWLDEQPKRSVVFLCFGSMGVFSAEQIKEVAMGLERSKQRFMWVVRSPVSSDPSKRYEPPGEPDLENLLPEGFMERTKDTGLVVKSWAPQAAVLMHESVGAFVTHCGWNSVLEAIKGGVPMIGWPLYGEERLILVYLVEELKMAVEMKRCEEGNVVKAEEVEMKVKWLMECEGGKGLRERTVMARDEAAAALEAGGGSTLALLELVKELKQVGDH